MSKSGEPKRVPGPQVHKKRRSAASRVVMSLIVLALLGAALAGGALYYAYHEFNLPGPLAEKKVFVVDKGLGTPDIAAQLESAGIIKDARIFTAMAQITGDRSRLKAGEYEFPAKASMSDVMGLIASGKSIVYKLTIPEGWTTDAAMARVAANEVLSGTISKVPAEGAIMPDTYVFRRGKTRQELVDEMTAAQAKLLDELWAVRKPVMNLKTKEDVLTLASIVEKETGKAEERPLIASVFINRLDKGMRLQSDPTIIYGITLGKGKLERPLTRADIQAPTPYNTYTINGLPPGPIANPGRAALEAVTNPPDTGNLYFVADGSGGHAFATTLEEHNSNVAKWRKIANGTASAAAEPEADAPPSAAPAPAPAAAAQPAPASGSGDAAAAPDVAGPDLPDLATVVDPAAVASAPAMPETTPAAKPAEAPATAVVPPPAAPAPAVEPETKAAGVPKPETPAVPPKPEVPAAAEAPAPQTPAVPPKPEVPTAAAKPVSEPQAAEDAAVAPSKPVEPAPKPVAKPAAKPATPAVAAAPAVETPAAKPATERVLKPGMVLKVGGKLTAIPKRKPKH